MSDVDRYTAEERALYDVLFNIALPIYERAYALADLDDEDETAEQGRRTDMLLDKRAEAVCFAVVRNMKDTKLPPRARPIAWIIGDACRGAYDAAQIQGGED